MEGTIGKISEVKIRGDNCIPTLRTRVRSTAPDISPIEGHAGAGLGYASADDITQLTLDYDAEMREKYLGHTIRLEWRYHF